MVCTVSPQLFTDWENFPSGELNISRLFQLVTQAFNRLTASANIFENVSRLHLPGKSGKNIIYGLFENVGLNH